MSGAKWKNGYYVRSLPETSGKSASDGQRIQRAKFALVSRFLKPMKDLVAFSFDDPDINMTGYNRAQSYILKNAICGAYPAYRIHYPSVLISSGFLPNALQPAAALGDDGSVVYTWTDNSGMGKAGPDDSTLLFVYCEAISQCNYRVGDATRSSGTATYDLRPYKGQTIQTWLAFISADGKDISPGVFTGELTLIIS
jgi:hypothetical protein